MSGALLSMTIGVIGGKERNKAMTLFDTDEGVKTTTSMVEQALTLPVDPSIRQEVRRFGFEYEMLPSGHQDTYGTPELDAAVNAHMAEWRDARDEDGEFDYWDDDDIDRAYDEERRDFAILYRREHGMHGGTPDGGPMGLIHRAYANSLIADNSRHSYHCSCEDCRYDRPGPLMTAQSDCTVGVEFVSRVIDLADFDHAATDIQTWVEMMEFWAEDGHWMPDGHTSCGNHVHVSSDGDGDDDDSDPGHWAGTVVRSSAFGNVNALYAAFDWHNIADGGCGSIRGYNHKPGRGSSYGTGGGGSWLSDRGYGTFEHRVWNTPRDPQRLWAHLGISIGLQRWGFNIAQNMPEATFWDVRHDRYDSRTSMSDEVYNALTNNVGEIVRGIRAYIPQHDRFDIARDLIVNLTPTY